MLYITRKEYYKLVNEFVDLDKESMINAYPYLFDAICCYWFHLPKRTVNSLFNGLGYGNWKHLWETDEEKAKTIDELCEVLRWEVFHSSDRMTWDRLLRTHWIWQRIQERLRKEEG